MGNSALKAMGGGVSITKARGFVKDLEFKGKTYKILPSFHPSFILRKPAYLDYAVKDFQAVKYYLDNEQERPQNKDLNYKAVTTIDQVTAFFEKFEKGYRPLLPYNSREGCQLRHPEPLECSQFVERVPNYPHYYRKSFVCLQN